MQYTTLGNTDLEVSRICLGTMTFGKQTGEDEASRILDAASSAGVTFIDTADGYPMGMPDLSRAGLTEKVVGRWLKGKRDRFIIATKAGAQMSDDPEDQGGSRKHLLDAIDGSLRRLDTDYVDLYQMHFDDLATPLEETLRALDEIVTSGKARYIGVSNIGAERLAEALAISDRLGLARYVSVQPRYNLIYRDAERDLLPLAKTEHLGVIPYNPLAGGFLTNRYRSSDAPATGRFSAEIGRFATMYRERYWNDSAFRFVERAQRIADNLNVTLTTLAIAWLLSKPAVTAPIVGASKVEQLTDSLKAADVQLDAGILAQLDEL
ncbi:MAG: aldo/keto reductase [Candidatus Eremiobacteraeota bacterium]|nr:aldo/keto reductase [Candidatus Eremiobacteraeota bacterium]